MIKRLSIIFAIIIIFSTFFVSCGRKKETPTFTVPSVTSVPTDLPGGDELILTLGGRKLHADKSSFADSIGLDGGDTLLTVENGSGDDVEMILLFSGAVNAEGGGVRSLFDGRGLSLEIANGENIDLSLSSGECSLAAAAFTIGARSVTFVCSADALTLCTTDDSFPKTLSITQNTSLDALFVTRPCYLVLESTTLAVSGDISLSFEGEGGFSIVESDGGRLTCGDFYADARECDIVLPESISDNLSPLSYHLRARSLNAEKLEFDAIEIASEGALERLVDEDKLPRLYSGEKIRFTSGCRIESPHTIALPVDIELCEGAIIESAITVASDADCNIYISAPEGTYTGATPVLIDAPNASVIWNECTMNIATAAELWRFETLNGRARTDGLLGGESAAHIDKVSLSKKDNLISSNIDYTVDGYIINATIDCVADTESLKNALLSIEAIGNIENSGAVDLLDPLGASLCVTDSDGNVCRYLILTEYLPTKLPVIVIDTTVSSSDIPRDDYVGGTIRINAECADGFEGLDKTSVSIRGRGNSTWKWDKKPYKLKFDEKTSVLGLASAKKWVLLANYSDKSLIRNTLAMSAAKFLDNMKWAPTQHPVDLFLNGEYIGVYSIGEQIESGDGRVELTDNGDELDTGYLIEIGGTDSGDVWDETCFMTDLIKYAKIKTPKEGSLTKAQVAYIKDYVIKADEAVKALDGYDEYIDIDSLIDWFILHELSYNLDSSFRRSCYITKDAGGKLTMGPVWDFDLAFGNFNRDKLDGKGWACLYDKDDYVWTNWITYLLSDQKFVDRLSARWEEIGGALVEYLYDEIDRLYELVSPSATENFKVWKILNIKIGYQPTAHVKYNTYEKQIDFLKEYIERRAKWMDENVSVVVPFDPEG